MMQKDEPYKLEIQVAYRPKEEELSRLGSEIREDIEQVKESMLLIKLYDVGAINKEDSL